MSMKKADLEKHAAKQLDGKMKAGSASARYGQGTTRKILEAEANPKIPKPKAVQITCRMPAELAAKLQARAVATEGGMSAVLAQAVEHWLATEP